MGITTAKKELEGIGLTALAFGVFVYFSFHLLHGDRGYFALQGAKQRLAQTQERYENIKSEREHLQHRVVLLRPQSLDIDMLDERVRAVLGYSHPDELIIPEN